MKEACISLGSGGLTFMKCVGGLQKIGESVLSSATGVGGLYSKFQMRSNACSVACDSCVAWANRACPAQKTDKSRTSNLITLCMQVTCKP